MVKSKVKVLLFFIFLIVSCKSGDPDVSNIPVNVNFNRLDQEIYESESKRSILDLIDNNRKELDLYYGLYNMPSDTSLANLLWKRRQNPSIDSFYRFHYSPEFENLEWLKNEAEDFFAHILFYYPNYSVPAISTIFSAFLDRDIVMDSSDIVVSLDFFLGPKAQYRPRLPEYMARRYQREYLVPMFIGLGISQSFNQIDPRDQTLLSEMIYYGKAQLFVSKMAPNVSDSVLLGYSSSELEFARNNFENVWAYFIERDLLFTTNYSEINRYVGERPKTVEIGPECPGRIGRYIGYMVVKSYLESSGENDIVSVMAEPDAQKIFRESGFNPSKLPD